MSKSEHRMSDPCASAEDALLKNRQLQRIVAARIECLQLSLRGMVNDLLAAVHPEATNMQRTNPSTLTESTNLLSYTSVPLPPLDRNETDAADCVTEVHLGPFHHSHRHCALGRRGRASALISRDARCGRPQSYDDQRDDHRTMEKVCHAYEPFALAFIVCPSRREQAVIDCDALQEQGEEESQQKQAAAEGPSSCTRRASELVIVASPFNVDEQTLFEAQLMFPSPLDVVHMYEGRSTTIWTRAMDETLITQISERIGVGTTNNIAPTTSAVSESTEDEHVKPMAGRLVRHSMSGADWTSTALAIRQHHLVCRRPLAICGQTNVRYSANRTSSITSLCCRHRWETVLLPLLSSLLHTSSSVVSMSWPSLRDIVLDASQQLTSMSTAAAASSSWDDQDDAQLFRHVQWHRFLVCRPVWCTISEALQPPHHLEEYTATTTGGADPYSSGGMSSNESECGEPNRVDTFKAVKRAGDNTKASSFELDYVVRLTHALRKRSPFSLAQHFQRHQNPYQTVSLRVVGLSRTVYAAMKSFIESCDCSRMGKKRRGIFDTLRAAVVEGLPPAVQGSFTPEEDARLLWCANNLDSEGDSSAVNPSMLFTEYTLLVYSLVDKEWAQRGASGEQWGAVPFFSTKYFLRSRSQVLDRWHVLSAHRAGVDHGTTHGGGVDVALGGGLIGPSSSFVPSPLPATSLRDTRLAFVGAVGLVAIRALMTATHARPTTNLDWRTVATFVLDGLITNRNLLDRRWHVSKLSIFLPSTKKRSEKKRLKRSKRSREDDDGQVVMSDGGGCVDNKEEETRRNDRDDALIPLALTNPPASPQPLADDAHNDGGRELDNHDTLFVWDSHTDELLLRLVEELRIPWRIELADMAATMSTAPAAAAVDADTRSIHACREGDNMVVLLPDRRDRRWGQLAYILSVAFAQRAYHGSATTPPVPSSAGESETQGKKRGPKSSKNVAIKRCVTATDCHRRFVILQVGS